MARSLESQMPATPAPAPYGQPVPSISFGIPQMPGTYPSTPQPPSAMYQGQYSQCTLLRLLVPSVTDSSPKHLIKVHTEVLRHSHIQVHLNRTKVSNNNHLHPLDCLLSVQDLAHHVWDPRRHHHQMRGYHQTLRHLHAL